MSCTVGKGGYQSYHNQKKNHLENNFFQVREKSGKFVVGQGIWKGLEKSGESQGI